MTYTRTAMVTIFRFCQTVLEPWNSKLFRQWFGGLLIFKVWVYLFVLHEILNAFKGQRGVLNDFILEKSYEQKPE